MMFELLPNWHPVFVHFSIALYTTAAGLYLLSALSPMARWSRPALTAARVNLWGGAVISIGTVAAGIYALLTVSHDATQLRQIAAHRNWAIATAVLWGLIALWEVRQARRSASLRFSFVALVLLALIPLGVAGWKGGELVYRYRVGVLPVAEQAGSPAPERTTFPAVVESHQ